MLARAPQRRTKRVKLDKRDRRNEAGRTSHPPRLLFHVHVVNKEIGILGASVGRGSLDDFAENWRCKSAGKTSVPVACSQAFAGTLLKATLI